MKLLISPFHLFNRNSCIFLRKKLNGFLIFATLIFSFSAKSQPLINEVMINPQTDDSDAEFQSLKVCSQSTFGSEYIELYNPTSCPLDISCYLIGFNSSSHGTFRFPQNSIIPPNGFISVGGPNSGATINLFGFCSTSQLNTAGDRWYIPNGEGYIMLWDAAGIAIDAVYWTLSANQATKWGIDSDISFAPTRIANPNSCNSLSSLNGPSLIQRSSPIVHYAGESPTIGSVIHRITDGSKIWATDGVPSLNSCNGKCQTSKATFSLNAQISQPNCGQSDGVIDLNPAPNENYTYSWSKPIGNESKTASNLAQGSYSIRIKNAKECFIDTTIVLVANCGGCSLVSDVTVSPNSDCKPCNYVGPSVVINEINVFPNNGDGCIFGKFPNPPGKGEWIELFNPNWCKPLDISNFILGSYNSVNSTEIPASNGMSFILPKGLILPPLGYAIIRGSEAPKPPVGVIDVVVNGNNLCIDGGISNSRMWFANNGGWLALYNSSGVPQDAIKWSYPALTDLNKSPCIPPSNSLPAGTTSLPTFNQIAALGLTSTLIPPSKGKSFRRFPDGGSWSGTLADENSSYGTCNDINSCAIFSTVSKCNGSATVNINSGVEPFTFQWNDPLKQTKQTATNLCEGNYKVVVMDASNCSKTYDVIVGKGNFSITANVTQPGCSQSNGSINLNPQNVNYSYKWTPNVSTSNIANNLGKGIYKIVISEGSCTFDTTIVLQNPTAFSASVNSTNTTCGLDNGDAEVIVMTPGNYTYTWTPNISSTNFASNLKAGDYYISVSDNNCDQILTANIGSSMAIKAVINLKNTTCNEKNGAVGVDLSPPSEYTYSWIPSVSNTDSASNLQSGSYEISFTDGICSGDTAVLISSIPVPTDIIYQIVPTNCGTSNGSISVNEVLGGQKPYSFSFNGQKSFTSSTDTSGLSNKEYFIAVKDSNNCIFQKSFSIDELPGPNGLISEQTNPICGDSSGSILLIDGIGGVAPYTFKWNGQSTTNTQFSALSVGSYSVEVVDLFGCVFSKSIELINETGSSTVFIPNVFTPNSDENDVNEYWKIDASCIESVSGVVLNRWGNPVFEFDDISDKWDGKTLSGDSVTDGVYFYKVLVNYLDQSSETLHGNITVIR
jgi:gliding motility-associated-like protein